MSTIVDNFMSAASKRLIQLTHRQHPYKPWVIEVYVRSMGGKGKWTLLSTSEYADEDVARQDFETRRPNFRVSEESNTQYGRGKRLVQEALQEKLK